MPQRVTVVSLSAKDRELLSRLLETERARVRNTQRPHKRTIEDEEQMAPECYVVRAPADGIPAIDIHGTANLNDDVPNHTFCQIYSLDEDTGILLAVPEEFVDVYNLSEEEVPENSWILAHRDKWGIWYAGAVVGGSTEVGTGSVGTGTGTSTPITEEYEDFLIKCPTRIGDTTYFPARRIYFYSDNTCVRGPIVAYCPIEMCCDDLGTGVGTGTGSGTGTGPPYNCIAGVSSGTPYLIARSGVMELLIDDVSVVSQSVTYDPVSDRWEGFFTAYPCETESPDVTVVSFTATLDGTIIRLKGSMIGNGVYADLATTIPMPAYGQAISGQDIAFPTDFFPPGVFVMCGIDLNVTASRLKLKFSTATCAKLTSCVDPGSWTGYTGSLHGTLSVKSDEINGGVEVDYVINASGVGPYVYSNSPVISWGYNGSSYGSFGIHAGITCSAGVFNAEVTWKGGGYMLPLTPVSIGDINSPSGSISYSAASIDFGGGDILTNVTVTMTWGVPP